MGFFQKLFGLAPSPPAEPPQPAEELGAALLRLTRQYWTRDPAERARLEPEVDTLPWPKLLRLHHLVALEVLHVNGLDAIDLPASPDATLLVRTAARLSGPTSPYRPRPATVTQRARGPAPGRVLQGELRNASSSHFGALEVLRLNPQNHPVALDFVPFAELSAVVVGPPSLFPPSQLHYPDGRLEVACLPLLYGVSWFSKTPSDQDGSMTRFVALHQEIQGGLGVGHQDFLAGGSMFGMSSVQQIVFS